MKKKTVVLVGAGHAHLEVIHALSKKEISLHNFILVAPSPQTFYSGLLPRWIAGDISLRQLTIESAAMAQTKGFIFIKDSLVAVDTDHKQILLASGNRIQFDLLSLNLGALQKSIPTESPQETIYLRPFEQFLPKWTQLQDQLGKIKNPRWIVVGGGAAAVEVATALRTQLNRRGIVDGSVSLVSKAPRLCENYPPDISQGIYKSLQDYRVRVILNAPVLQIGKNVLALKDQSSLGFDAIFIATPTVPQVEFPSGADEFLCVEEGIFSAGDGMHMIHYPKLARSGVNAIRQGRHLLLNIRNSLSGKPLLTFQPPRKQLNILITGNQSARLVWGKFSFLGYWPFVLKAWIDERYIAKF